MNCRSCDTVLSDVFADLGHSPASNSFLKKEQLNEPETYFPLKVYTCPACFLVQIDEYKKSDAIFDDAYVYFSSYSTTMLAHSKKYVELMTSTLGLGAESLVAEIASNDGYLLQYFLEKKVPVLGIEPTANTAEVAQKKGIETVVEFFGVALAQKLVKEGRQADLLLGNNVLAHVPDINDFVGGMKIFLNENGVITMEFPHVLQLINHNQFDTIYHEHFSYLSLYTVEKIFAAHDLTIFDVEEVTTHGGSLRIYAKHTQDDTKNTTVRLTELQKKEKESGIDNIELYKNFQEKAITVKNDLLTFLIQAYKDGKSVAAYGAAAKGNTLLNYSGIKNDLIKFVVDANPHKQGTFLPGCHIPVVAEEKLKEERPDYIIILPWNLRTEISAQLSYVKEWGAQFVTPIPSLEIF